VSELHEAMETLGEGTGVLPDALEAEVTARTELLVRDLTEIPEKSRANVVGSEHGFKPATFASAIRKGGIPEPPRAPLRAQVFNFTRDGREA